MGGSGEGVQVLFVEEDGRYRCDEGALRRVVASSAGAARGLPVAVVSVAGATRGGKSFLLDFFLRYLRASDAARLSGAWLGADDEALTGFNWRGGCERHTEGILIWSEPIIVTLGSKGKMEKVAVVLLDTQGSFDSSSTMRDSSTVFALSMLLSSVQIYNLSQNIKEDDLHYLQLFTEYGKLAREKDVGKPFQELRFLVRDWCYAYEHPPGAEGGQQLLDKRLEIRGDHASELREIRAHVRDAFERVQGFLMPHPGLTVATNPTFTGCLKDISAEFKSALLELIPSLFDPENLTIKHINGQKVTLQDFIEYFKTYVEIFNSDTLPTPTTVMQATSAASLEVALRACRAEYSAQMERSAGGAACVARGALLQHHADALAAARHSFTVRRTLANPVLATARLDALLQELDLSLGDYEAMNSGRILETAGRCKAGYEAAMQTDECLAPEELSARHNSAVVTAREAFQAEFTARQEAIDEQDDKINENEDNNKADENNVKELNEDCEEHKESSKGFQDENADWKTLEKELEELLPLHRERNATRISAAQESARDMYTVHMRKALNSAACLHLHSLRSLHTAAVTAATDHMLLSWHDANTVPIHHKEELRSYIEDKYREFVATNDANNQIAVEEAINIYKNIMSEICNDAGGRCLHPRDLMAQHNRAQQAARAHFVERRDAATPHLPVDNYERSVIKGLIPHYRKFELENEARNKQAVTEALEYYKMRIAPIQAGDAGVLDIFGPPDMDVFSRHPRIKREAVDHFKNRRRSSGVDYVQDPYLDDLNKKIDDCYTWITFKVATNIATASAGALAVGAMMFMRR